MVRTASLDTIGTWLKADGYFTPASVIDLELGQDYDIMLTIAEPVPQQTFDLPTRLVDRQVETKPKKIWLMRTALGIVFLVLAGNAVACEHGRGVFVELLQSHIPAGLLYGGVVLVRRAERWVPTAVSCEKELAKETSKAVAETALFSMASAAMKTFWDAMQ